MNVKNLLRELQISLIAVLSLAVLVCGVYPLIVWGLAQGLFPDKANGSLIVKHGSIAGSRLLSQGFTGAQYFHPRPSAAGSGYDASRSGGSNLGPLSRSLMETIERRVHDYRAGNGLAPGTGVPIDAVTASGSGLDPHISPENALLQAPRVARARGLTEEAVRRRIAVYTEGRSLGILGEPRVNVLLLNLGLDKG